MNLLKGNGGANDNHSVDMKDMRVGKSVRKPNGIMIKANTKNTRAKTSPLKPTQGK